MSERERKIGKGVIVVSIILAVISLLVGLLLRASEAEMWEVPFLLIPLVLFPIVFIIMGKRADDKEAIKIERRKDIVINCAHCGHEYNCTISNCPECAEPTPEIQTEEEQAEKKRHDYRNSFICSCITGVIGALLFAAVLAFIICFYFLLTETVIMPFLPIFATFAAVGVILAIGVLATLRKDKRWRNIRAQFHADDTSICPECGSHDLSFGRKGYDWNYAFWGSMFKLRGSQYIAGMDSRRVIAHCNKCGHSWKTSREWLR